MGKNNCASNWKNLDKYINYSIFCLVIRKANKYLKFIYGGNLSLLQEIQNEAVDSSSDLSALLRKCKLLAARLNSKPLENWLLWESNGYPNDIDVPYYRKWPLELKGHFSGPFGSGIRNAPIPLACLPQKDKELFREYKCRQSIASIEQSVKECKGDTLQVSAGDLHLVLGMKVYENQNCLQAWAEFGKGNLIELLNTVRNKIHSWLPNSVW